MTTKKKWWITGIVCLLVCLLVPLGYFIREVKLNEFRDEAIKKLERDIGQYDDQSIVLNNTTKVKAEKLAEQFGATLRITKDGSFATLTLPEGVTIRDIYARDDARSYIQDMAADYQVQMSELNNGEDEGIKANRLPSRPSHSVSDSDYALQSYLDYLNMQNTWSNYTGTDITVAVIDTGIDTDHPEFVGRISEYSYNATEDKVVKDWLCEDDSYDWSLIEDEVGHGTAVTGVIAASMNSGKVVGIAPEVNIIVIKVECNSAGVFERTSDLIFGLYYAIERDVQVVNMSFGGNTCQDWERPVQLAYDSDIICVAAAGNYGTSALTYPAALDKVIGVGALAADSWTLATYSNYGENSDLVAPGSTYTTLMNDAYGTMDGTSLAAPVVTAAVALYMQRDRYVTFDEITEVLFASCYDLGDLGNDWEYGYGALDISAFLLEERGTVIYDMLSDEVENKEAIFIRGHALQELPEPERLYAVFDGWYYDDTFTQAVEYYTDAFYGDLTLYAKWTNEDDGVPYTYVILDDGTVEIRSYTGHRRYITIPERIEGRVVSSIGDFAFAGQSKIREITLPSGLTNIGRYAFENCSNLVSIEIPESVTRIGEYAFWDNVRLRTVAFLGNSNLEKIEDLAFAHCSSLEKIDLPASLTSVNGSAFYGTVALHTIQVHANNGSFVSKDGVLFNFAEDTLIAYPAAKGMSYVVPENVNTIGMYAFSYAGLNTVDLSSVRYIQEMAFIYSQLVELYLPDEIISVGKAAFSQNTNLYRVSLGRGLTNIDAQVFYGCSSLSDITIPSQIVGIGLQAFGCSGLTNVTFEEDSSLLCVGDEAFLRCKIREISFPDSLIAIGDSAFSDSALEEITFGTNSQLQSVGNMAFYGCVNLTEISLPSKLETIGELAFADTGLVVVTIPQSVTALGGGAFAYNDGLSQILVKDGNLAYHSVSGVVYTIDNKTLVQYPAGKTDTFYNVNDLTQTVASYAFAGTVNLLNVTLPEGVEILAQNSFHRSGIQSISLPSTLVAIEEYAFCDCGNLISLAIPDNVIQIGRYAVAGCNNLFAVTFSLNAKLSRIGKEAFAYSGITSFTVPANVSTIAQGAFTGCNALTTLIFAENSKLESISAYMFDGCDNLRQIKFMSGSKLTSIQAHALEGMDKLTSIDFGDAKITNLDNFAFRFCESLSELNLPDTLTNIGRYAFYGCSKLDELTVPANIEHIGSYAFLGTDDLELYMASDSMPKYLDENWDSGIKGYYAGVTSVETSGDYKYAVLTSGHIAIIEYLGSDSHVDLSELNLGANITTIGGSAFEDSTVTSIVLPDTLTEIQAEAFRYTDIKEIVIPAGVTFIGREAFAHTDLETLTFAEGSVLALIEQYAFKGTDKLKAVALPAALKTMGTGVFMNSGLETVNFAEGILLTEIPQNAFAESKLTAVTLPDSVTLVNHNAFYNVQSLKNVTFGDNDGIRLMNNVFYHTGLTNVHIPANVTYIGEYCFVALSNLTEFSVDENNPNYMSKDGLLLDKSGRKLIVVPAGRTGSLTVPQSVEAIGFGAFEESKLSEILFHPDANILTFGYRAFFKAELLTEITIPSSVVSIDYYAFAYCKNLQTVTFEAGNKLKGIYEGAFLGCINLTNITLPESIVEISDFAFYGCTRIKQIPIANGSAIQGIYDYAFAYTGIAGEFTLPETLIDLGSYSFLGTKVTKVTIPDTNKQELIIGIGAFEGCTKLEEITLPFIGASFDNEQISWFGYIFGAGSYNGNEAYVPKSLKTVTITEGITGIYQGGFANCTGLEVINVPHSVCVLGWNSFLNTTARYELTNTITTTWSNGYTDGFVGEGYFGSGIVGTVTLADGTCRFFRAFYGCTYLERVILPDSVTDIGYGTFFECVTLKEIIIPDSVTSIGQATFANCKSLKEIIIPNSVTHISSSAFSGCSALEEIMIPESVTSIDDFAFTGCEKLYIVHNNSSLELTLGSSDHGFVAWYANVIIDKNGNKTYRDIDSGFIYVDTADGFRFYKEYDSYTLISYFGAEDTVQLPDNINGQTYSIKNFTGAKNVIIPGTVSEIGREAFNNSELQSVTILDGVERLAWQAFLNCDNLVDVKLPSSVYSIAAQAFFGCSNLEKIIVDENNEMYCSVEGIVYNKMSKEITVVPEGKKGTVVIPDFIKRIDNNIIFSECNNINTIVIHDQVRHIGANVFSGLENLETIIISENNKNYCMLDGVLYDIDLTRVYWASPLLEGTVSLPESLIEISGNAFRNCAKITELRLPNKLKSIGWDAFYGCNNLRSITIPNSIEDVSNSFSNCPKLERIDIESLEAWCTMGRIQEISIHQSFDLYLNGILMEDVVVPSGITSILPYTFASCRSVKSIVLPESITSIGAGAFYECSNLKSIEIPDSVVSIRWGAFLNCSNLQSIELPDSITVIESDAFQGCVSLESIKIPYGITSISGGTFSECSNLKSVELPESVTTIENTAFSGCGLRNINIPDSVSVIGDHAFGYSGLESIKIPDSVTSIGKYAFFGCENLIEVVLSNSITEIEDNTFYGCTSLRSISIPSEVKSIREGAFADCKTLFEIYNFSSIALSFGSDDNGQIALNAKLIVDKDGNKTYAEDCYEYETFETEDGFKFIKINGEYTLIAYTGPNETVTLPASINGKSYKLSRFRGGRHIIIPNGRTVIDDYAFYGNGTIKSVEIPSSVTSIGNSAFALCTNLESIIIPDSVTSIGWGAFSNCSSLESVRLPSGITTINDTLFSYCASLKSIKIPDSVTYIGYWAFYQCRQFENVNIPDGVTYIGEKAFEGTACVNNPDNLSNGMLIIDGWLVWVSKDITYHSLDDLEGIRGVSYDAYNDAILVKNPIWASGNIYGASNAETLLVSNLKYMYSSGSYIPSSQFNLTLKNVVVLRSVGVTELYEYPKIFSGLTGVTIFVEALEEELRWDENFPGWNNGNKVLYGDEWTWAHFYDEDGNIISSTPRRNSQVIRLPIYQKDETAQYGYEVIGWDLDGDGTADSVPATSIENINATVLVNRFVKTYKVIFEDSESGEIYYQAELPYGTAIVPPAAPSNEKAVFEGWNGYVTGMTVTEDCTFLAEWHTHNYETVVTAPTCTDGGYTTHTCPCGDSYVDSYTNELGHDMGEWYVITEPTCTIVGEKQSDCSRCDHVSHAEIPATGHSYTHTVIPPTVDAQGYTLHSCSACGHSYSDNFVDKLIITGNLDDNTTVDKDDAIYLLMHTFFPEDYPLEQDCDFDGNGQVDKDDAIHLLMYTFFPNDYPLIKKASTVYALVPASKKEDE